MYEVFASNIGTYDYRFKLNFTLIFEWNTSMFISYIYIKNKVSYSLHPNIPRHAVPTD
jgi:hypothetical protein